MFHLSVFQQKKIKQMLAIVLSVAMVLSMLPADNLVFAAPGTSNTTTWSFAANDGGLNHDASGATYDFDGLTIDATEGTTVNNGSYTTLSAGVVLTVPISNGDKIEVKTVDATSDYIVDGQVATSDAFSYTYEGDGESIDVVVNNNIDLISVSVRKDNGLDAESNVGEKEYVFNADDLTTATYESNFEAGDENKFLVKATSDRNVTVTTSSKTADDGTSFSKVLKLGGTGKADYRSIHFNIPEIGKIKIYAMSSGSNDRKLTLYKADGTEVSSVTAYLNNLTEETIDITEAGDYYLASPSSGVNVYGLDLKLMVAEREYVFNADDLTTATYESNFEAGDENKFLVKATSDRNVTVTTSSKTADDGTSFSKALKLGGTGKADYRSIHFSLPCTGKIKVYAMSSGSNDRKLTLYKTDGTEVSSVTAYLSDLTEETIDITEAGDYYLASPSSGVNVYCCVLSYGGFGESTVERADWATVADPNITNVEQVEDKINVTFNLVTGDDGADKATVYMYDASGAEVGSVLVGKDTTTTTRTAELSPEASGNYTFKVVAERTDETTTKESTISSSFVYLLPLEASTIKSATNTGSGTVNVVWSKVSEATSYIIAYKNVNDASYTESEAFTTAYGSVSGLPIGEKYSFKVIAKRGSDTKTSAAIELSITEEAQRAWAFSAFGQGVNVADNYYEGNANEGSVTVASENGKGKLVPPSTDGLAFYYTTIDPDKENFILSATVNVDSWTYSNGQEGFGLMAADAVGEPADNSIFWNNSYMATVTKVEYYWDSENKVTVDAGAGDKITMKLGVGAQEKTGATAANIADGTIVTNVGQLVKAPMATLETSCAELGVGTYNIIGNYKNATAPTGTVASPVTSLKLKIQRDNTGYRLSYTDPEGNTTTKLYYDIERDNLTQVDEDNIYLGFFASRNAKITVTDIELTTSDPATDAPAEEREKTYITPNYQTISKTETGSASHQLVFLANADGKLTIKDSAGNVIVENAVVTANSYYKKSVTLKQGISTYVFTFTPDADYKPSEFSELKSYKPVTYNHSVTYKKYNRTVLYVSPTGTSTGTGSKTSPLDVYTAVKYVTAGQMIVLAGGTYNLSEKIVVERGTDGTEQNMIYMLTDPASEERAVFDFNSKCTGIVFAGDYWYIKGFDVTRSQDAQKGLQISGDHCVLDNVNAYYNGNTGIQISRYLSTDAYEDWPSYNTILNCTSYGNADHGYEDADGFAAKLTIGDGNVFDGCMAYNNADDGWDLFAKLESGRIGKVVIKNCVAYGNGYLPDGTNAGNGNGFKLGGSSISGYHTLINCVSFNNKAKGIDSNSCPDIQVYNCTSFNNESYNVAFYTNDAANTDYYAEGLLSYRTENLTVGENIKPKGTQDTNKIYGTSNYYWYTDTVNSHNIDSNVAANSWFESLDTTTQITRNSDGTLNMNGLLELTQDAPSSVGAVIGGTASAVIEVPADSTPTTPSSSVVVPTEDEKATSENEIILSVDVNGNTDWNSVVNEINETINKDATGTQEIKIDMNGETKVSKDLFESMKGKNVEITLVLNSRCSWIIDGTKVKAADEAQIDLGVDIETNHVPETVIVNTVKPMNNKQYVEVSLRHDGAFGFGANLKVDLTSSINDFKDALSEAGKGESINTKKLIAALYYYNPKTEKLVFQSAYKVKDNEAIFPFEHASDYVVVLGDSITLDDDTVDEILVNGKDSSTPTSKTLYVGGTTKKTYTLNVTYPESIEEAIASGLLNGKVTFKSSKSSVAVVSSNGKITAKKAGTTTITTTVEVGDKTLTFKTKVTVKKASIKLTQTDTKMEVGDSATFKVTLYGYKASDIVWKTSKKSVATVKKNAGKTETVVTAIKAGTATISACISGKDVNAKVKVTVK